MSFYKLFNLALYLLLCISCSSVKQDVTKKENEIFTHSIPMNNENPNRTVNVQTAELIHSEKINDYYFEADQSDNYTLSSENKHLASQKFVGTVPSINFIDTEIHEFVKVIFEEVFKVNYIIDPSITGNITLNTSTSITKQQLYNITESVLEENGAQILYNNGIYSIKKMDNKNAERSIIVSLKHIDAKRLIEELKTILPKDINIEHNKTANSLIVTGNPQKFDAVISILKSFDKDELKGLSFALLHIRHTSSQTIIPELRQVLRITENSDTTLTSISRINSILIVTPRKSILREAKKWIKRLDQDIQKNVRSYVYQVQNRPVEELAKILSDAFVNNSQIAVNEEKKYLSTIESKENDNQAYINQNIQNKQLDVKIIPDSASNSLIIFATPDNYKIIAEAIYKIDITPLQVLIEATIAEVALNDSLKHGVSWYLNNNNGLTTNFSNSSLSQSTTINPGFNVTLGSTNANIVLSALEEITEVEIISTPSMTVLDNQTANLQVGDQVPIATQSINNTTSNTASSINTIELKDTGIILSVTPRLNSSGLVLLDIKQEVSDVTSTTSSGIDSPTIQQRKFQSTVAVKDGNHIILGGLISQKKQMNKSAVPVVHKIPVFGNLFKNKTKISTKNELVVIIKPTIIRNQTDINAIAEELNFKMPNLANMRIQ